MEFKAYVIGNRIAIKTMKQTYSKVTHFRIEEAKKIIKKIQMNGWSINIDKNCSQIL